MLMLWSDEGSSHKTRWAKTTPAGGSSKHGTRGDLMAWRERHRPWLELADEKDRNQDEFGKKAVAKFYMVLGITVRSWASFRAQGKPLARIKQGRSNNPFMLYSHSCHCVDPGWQGPALGYRSSQQDPEETNTDSNQVGGGLWKGSKIS